MIGIQCPKCGGTIVMNQPMTVAQDHFCVQCGYAWNDPQPAISNGNMYQQAWQNPFAGVPLGDGPNPDATAPSLEQAKALASLLTPQDRQALYEYLRNIHGCRIW